MALTARTDLARHVGKRGFELRVRGARRIVHVRPRAAAVGDEVHRKSRWVHWAASVRSPGATMIEGLRCSRPTRHTDLPGRAAIGQRRCPLQIGAQSVAMRLRRPVAFAAGEIAAALRERGIRGRANDEWQTSARLLRGARELPAAAARRSLSRRHQARRIQARAHVDKRRRSYVSHLSRDDAGAMYGGLELAEQIRTLDLGDIPSIPIAIPTCPCAAPSSTFRSTCARPSYSDMSDSAQENIATVWDFEFWRAVSRCARARPLQLSCRCGTCIRFRRW